MKYYLLGFAYFLLFFFALNSPPSFSFQRCSQPGEGVEDTFQH
jgi:hypothetical protein